VCAAPGAYLMEGGGWGGVAALGGGIQQAAK